MTAEDRLQINVAKLLDSLAISWGFMWFHVPNQRSMGTTVGVVMKLLRMGMKKGNPDCHIVRNGSKTFHIELKTETGRLSKAQKEWRERDSRLNIPYYLCRSLDDVIHVLEKEFNRKVEGA